MAFTFTSIDNYVLLIIWCNFSVVIYFIYRSYFNYLIREPVQCYQINMYYVLVVRTNNYSCAGAKKVQPCQSQQPQLTSSPSQQHPGLPSVTLQQHPQPPSTIITASNSNPPYWAYHNTTPQGTAGLSIIHSFTLLHPPPPLPPDKTRQRL